MNKMIFAALTALSLGGCATYGGYGSGLSVGVSSGYGSQGYGYGQYGYDNNCIRYDRYQRPYYFCDSYYGASGYNQSRVVYYYPGYTYRQGYYYDQSNRRYEGRQLYRRHYMNNRHRRQAR